MRVLLVEPPFHAFMKYDRWFYPSSLTQLAAILHKEGHDVVIYDADKYFEKDLSTRDRNVFIGKQEDYYSDVDDLGHYIWNHFREILSEYNPDIVGVSVYTCKLQSVNNTLKIVRDFNPNIKTCVGGAHATAVPETMIIKSYIDAVFLGYADITLPEWLSAGCPSGIISSDKSKIDITLLPYSRRQSLLFPEYYTPKDMGHMMTSRGCIGRCTFCSNSFMWSGRQKYRTSISVENELEEMRNEWQVEDIHVGDSSLSDFPLESKRIATILKRSNLPWSCNVRWATVSQDLTSHFFECGCKRISVGLESGSDKILKHMKKGCNKQLIREKAQILNSLGIEWHLFCIVGFSIETIEDMQETLDLALEIKPTSISINSLSPLPGTKVYSNISGLTADFASTVNQLFPNHCFSSYMNINEYQDMFQKLTNEVGIYNKGCLE